jgi:hypothetical protein
LKNTAEQKSRLQQNAICDIQAPSAYLDVTVTVNFKDTEGDSLTSLDQCFSNFFLAYRCHSTEHIHVPFSQYRTHICTAVTIQNMYHYHIKEHIHVPLSQQRTCTCTAVTTQNMYMYHRHNREHVYVPLSQQRTRTCTAVTIENMYMYRCHNTEHVHVPLSI